MRRLQTTQLAYAARDAWLGAAVYGALATDPSFVDAAAAQIHGEMKIDELSAVAADRRVIKPPPESIGRGRGDYDQRCPGDPPGTEKFPRPDPRTELDVAADCRGGERAVTQGGACRGG